MDDFLVLIFLTTLPHLDLYTAPHSLKLSSFYSWLLGYHLLLALFLCSGHLKFLSLISLNYFTPYLLGYPGLNVGLCFLSLFLTLCVLSLGVSDTSEYTSDSKYVFSVRTFSTTLDLFPTFLVVSI